MTVRHLWLNHWQTIFCAYAQVVALMHENDSLFVCLVWEYTSPAAFHFLTAMMGFCPQRNRWGKVEEAKHSLGKICSGDKASIISKRIKWSNHCSCSHRRWQPKCLSFKEREWNNGGLWQGESYPRGHSRTKGRNKSEIEETAEKGKKKAYGYGDYSQSYAIPIWSGIGRYKTPQLMEAVK